MLGFFALSPEHAKPKTTDTETPNMFYFRINKLKVFDNREIKPVLGLFGRDLAQVKILSFVTTDNTDLPELDDLPQTNDPAKKVEIIKAAVTQVVSSRILTRIDHVKDNHVMTFGDTGYVLYQSKDIPADFNWSFIALESDKNVRDTGTMINDVLNDPGFKGFTTNLLAVLGGAANPTFTAGVEIAKFATQVVANTMKQNKDDMIGILYMSLNRREHYLHGERKKDDVPDLTNNMMIDYSIFAFE
jgi:hypothetical protein